MRRVVRDERGTTLVELLTGTLVALLVGAGALLLAEVGLRAATTTEDRVDAMQRGRQAMADVTQQLRSQVCLGTGIAAITAGDGDGLTFSADLGDDRFTPDRHRLRYDPVARTLTEDVFTGTGTPPAVSFPVQPSRRRVLATDVYPDGARPIFRYYAFTGAEPVTPSRQLAVPLGDTDRPRVVLVDVTFRVRPASGDERESSATTFENQVYVRSSDPMDPDRSPQCI